MAPSMGVQKTLHQRNKSSPALSSMSQAGGLKVAAKRTAFGDVSNTTNVPRPSKDDSTVGGNVGLNVAEKTVGSQPDKKIASLSRPAQRPLSVSGLKSLLSNVTSSNNQITTKQPLTEIQESAQPKSQIVNLRKAFTKRNTSVFKDLSQPQLEQKAPDVDPPSSTAVALDLVHHDLERPQDKKFAKDHKEIHHKVRRTKSYFVEPEYEERKIGALDLPESSGEASAIRSDGVYIDNNGDIQIYQCPAEAEEQDPLPASDQPGDPALPLDIKSKAEVTALSTILDEPLKRPQPKRHEQHKIPALSEPEEYWDEEEDDENYDEDGYVTARSYKSRGENTTNGGTTILFPKVNQRVKRELAAAKELMESAKITDDLDDESWDTTMVAEYGEEIFGYMKELEVCHIALYIGIHLIIPDRLRCSRTLIIWTIKLKFNGRCAPFLWTGSFRCIIDLAYYQKLSFYVSITLIDFYLARSSHSENFSLLVPQPFLLQQSMKRSIVRQFRK